jgi:hypothetical protein
MARKTVSRGKHSKKVQRKLDALPDTVDFRDRMYVPTLVEVKPTSDLKAYRTAKIPVLDQGREGACTGFALATVVNYLLRFGNSEAEAEEASARMLYVMAKRYDEWPGEDYEGSSARGAMKGWHKHGVCARRLWLDDRKELELSDEQAANALDRPLGAYFRVNHKDLVGLHSAITEVGILFATARVHEGWMNVQEGDREIQYSSTQLGGHAFAIVGYDRDGFWIQNSWGTKWGSDGLARLDYSDWLENGSDVWVARLGAPIDLSKPDAAARMRASAPRSYESYVYASLRPHIVTAGNDGKLLETGAYGLTASGLRNILREQLPKKVKDWKKKRVMLYAHGGLVKMDSAIQYVANYREDTLKAEVYPLAFIWRSDAWTTLKNILQDAIFRRKTEGILDDAKDFMLDRLDDTLEPIARNLGGKALWDEMKENATLSSSRATGAARMAAKHLVDLVKSGEINELHLVGHSAGAILLAPLVEFFKSQGVKVSSLSLWAPACTLELFSDLYEPLIKSGDIEAFDLYTLDDATERDDDCADIYHKSLLYLVSHAFERVPRIPLVRPDGTPLLGLERDVLVGIPNAFWTGQRRWIKAPGSAKSDARHHGDFDNDAETLLSTLERITGTSKSEMKAPEALRAPTAKVVRFREGLNAALVRN